MTGRVTLRQLFARPVGTMRSYRGDVERVTRQSREPWVPVGACGRSIGEPTVGVAGAGNAYP
jgi:hypothetical protein